MRGEEGTNRSNTDRPNRWPYTRRPFEASTVLALAAATCAWLMVARPAQAQIEAAPAPPEPAATAEPFGARASALFYFFSPDWRPPDLGKLGIALEETLAAGGARVSFQAFTRYEDFERKLVEAPPAYLIAPAWLGTTPPSAANLSLEVLARPVQRGKSTYRKALMTRPGIDSIDDLARGSIAATVHSMSAGSPATVLEAFHLAADSARVVPVPKDVDALLALTFGQVDAALVTSVQYEQLSRTRPDEAERLRVLAFSPEVKLPPVFASPAVGAAERDKLRDLLVKLADSEQGRSVLAMLGFDAFVAETAAPPPGHEQPPAVAAAPAETGAAGVSPEPAAGSKKGRAAKSAPKAQGKPPRTGSSRGR